ncbi:MAG: glycosyltransferase family 4 protein [Rhizomicrobium sp.]|jgi:glycosyltransferase involved in cell wall biosynthesis
MLDRTPKLLSINNYYYRRGGAEVLFLEQNRMLEEAGWQIALFAMKHADNLPTSWAKYFPDEIEFGQSYSAAGKLVRASRVIYSLQARQKLNELLDVFSPRIAHIHNIYHHLSPSILSLLRDRGVPVVMTVHDLKLGCPAYTMMRGDKPCESCRGGKLHNVVLNKCIKGSAALSAVVMMEAALHRFLRTYESSVARFVVPSRFVLETLVHWGWRRESFVYVPNFVDVERFQPGNKVGRRFVYCGRLDNLKGVETLVRAAALAGQPVTIVGRGPEEERLHKLAAELQADVAFAGYLTKQALTEVLQSARAVVIPSEVNENAPLSLLEAYATARPVIGSNIAGIPELIRQEETGALFETGNVHALAETLERFAGLPDTRIADMGQAGRRWVEQDFNPTTYRNRLLSLYASLERVAA